MNTRRKVAGVEMLGATIGLCVGWIIANTALMIWAVRTKPDLMMLLRLCRIANTIVGAGAIVLAVLGLGLGQVAVPLIDVFLIVGCYYLNRLNDKVRDMAR